MCGRRFSLKGNHDTHLRTHTRETIWMYNVWKAVLTGSTCLHVPAGYTGMSRWRHDMPAVVLWCRAGFWFVCRACFPRTMSLSALIGGARCPLAEELTHVYVKIVRPKCTQTWRDHNLLIARYCFTLYKEWICPNSYLYIYNKDCRQANGDNRHLVSDVPTGLDRDIRDMPIACARTHPDANKHARHIPMHRSVHSAHANKCSQKG